jgi:hypothetical protein
VAVYRPYNTRLLQRVLYNYLIKGQVMHEHGHENYERPGGYSTAAEQPYPPEAAMPPVTIGRQAAIRETTPRRAAEYVRTSDVPGETGSTHTGPVIDYRRSGGVVIKGILSRHGAEDFRAIADELKTTHTLAMEGPLSSAGDRQHREAIYSQAVRRYDYVTRRTFHDPSNTNELFSILQRVVGAGPQQVRLLDIDPSSPAWKAHQQSVRYGGEYGRGIQRLPRQGIAERARAKLANSILTSSTAREQYMQQRLETVTKDHARTNPDKTIGLFLGIGHAPMLPNIGEPLDAEASAQALQMSEQRSSPGVRAVNALRTGQDPTEHIQRAVLGDYIAISLHDSPQRAASLLAKSARLPAETTAAHLADIDAVLKQTPEAASRRQRVAEYLTQVGWQ